MTGRDARLFSWTIGAAQRLMRDTQRLPHALLLAGPRGLGKAALATRLTQVLTCVRPQDGTVACGTCQGCLLFGAGNHPDIRWIEPPEDKKVIAIDQIRALGEFLQLRPHTARYKIVVISPADAMNIQAANSLLKLLEEPPADSLLLLVSSDPARLPATVRSRCQRVEFMIPARAEALSWLRAVEGFPADQAELLLDLAGGAPLRALTLQQEGFLAVQSELRADVEAIAAGKADPVACAARWKSRGAQRCLEWLETAVMGLVRARMAPGTLATSAAAQLQVAEKGLDLKKLFRFLDTVSGRRQILAGTVDELLLLEDVLIRWSRVARQK